MVKLREDANHCKRSTRLGTEELRFRGDRDPSAVGIPHQGNCSHGVVHSSLSRPRALNRCRMSFRKKAGFAPLLSPWKAMLRTFFNGTFNNSSYPVVIICAIIQPFGSQNRTLFR